MTESNLTVVNPDHLMPSKYGDDEVFDKMATGGWLPRLQVMGGNTEIVKEGEADIGTYALIRSKTDFVQLPAQVEVLVYTWRPKAMDVHDKNNVVALYNPKSREFQSIQTRSEQPNSGCFWGPEFLVYVAQLREFAGFLMGSKTSRREAKNLKPLIGAAATLKIQLIKSKSFSWHSPQIFPCSSYSGDVPTDEAVQAILVPFNNPPESELEQAPPDAGTGRVT